jgi:hypothetical protein
MSVMETPALHRATRIYEAAARGLCGRGLLSQRKAAKLLRISRYAVVRGLTRNVDDIPRVVIISRCPTCGGLIQRPCRACALRRGKERIEG